MKPSPARIRRACISLSCAIALTATVAPTVHAQSPNAAADRAGSTYLSLGHWAYDYIDVLIARGQLKGLQPLVQPYRRIDIAQAILQAESKGDLAPAEQSWADELKRELAYEVRLLTAGGQDLRFSGEGAVGVKALTHTHRDVLRPEGDEGAYALLDLFLVGDGPLVAGAFRTRWDGHYLNDPQFPNGDVIEFRECDPIDQCAYRVEEGYVELQVPFVRLSFGRMYRNWGLPGVLGLMISDYPYSYDQIGYRFGNDRISLSGFFAMPNDFVADTVRYFTVHRLDWKIRDNLTLAMSESSLWGGPGARFDLALINPVGIWEVSGSKAQRERNTNGTLELWWKPTRGAVLYGGLLVDNTMFGEEGNKEGLTQWGAVLGAQLPALLPSLGARFDLSLINSLAYRSRVGFFESYTLDGIGYAHDRTDAIVASLQGDWFVGTSLVLQPRLDVMWKGEADITDPWPDNAFQDYPGILVGQVEHTVRPALRGRWRAWQADVEWDAGLSFIKDRGHQPIGWEVEPTARVVAQLRKSLLR